MNVNPLRVLTREAWEARMGDWFVPEPNTGCWLWTQGIRDKRTGYGSVFNRGANSYAHRVSYELLRGPIPSGLTLDHLCRCPSCVNPDHLEPVTQRENTYRGRGPASREATAQRTHCPAGHPYDEKNTGWCRGKRRCLACHRFKERTRQARKRTDG